MIDAAFFHGNAFGLSHDHATELLFDIGGQKFELFDPTTKLPTTFADFHAYIALALLFGGLQMEFMAPCVGAGSGVFELPRVVQA